MPPPLVAEEPVTALTPARVLSGPRGLVPPAGVPTHD